MSACCLVKGAYYYIGGVLGMRLEQLGELVKKNKDGKGRVKLSQREKDKKFLSKVSKNVYDYVSLVTPGEIEKGADLTKRYSSGVFLTITLPPIFPIGIAPKVLSYMIKQLRSWISKRIKRKFNLVTVREFQDNGFIHAHIVIFGVERIEDKEVLTKRLDLWMVTAILRLEKWFDYGVVKRLIKRYLRYCKKHKKYEGPINWITPINFRTGEWNPPPDALKFAKSKNCDGGFPSVGDYLSKYITKMYRAAKMISEGEIEASLLGPKVVLYWLTGVRMFSFDNKLYKELGLSRKRYRSGLRFLGSFIWFELPDHIFWEIYDQLCELGFVKKLQT